MDNIDIITGRNKKIQSIINKIPKNLRLKLNPDRLCVENFINKAASKTPRGFRVLDAGAGPCPYKNWFKHTLYEATDFKKNNEDIDFVCSLEKIPKKDNYYDVIILTEVLEHVEYPWKVVSELYRVLKKKGIIYITLPQGKYLHQEPHNFYYYTKYGIKSLLTNAGFREIKINPKGGFFWFLSDVIRFNGILEQIKNRKIYYILKFFEYPLTNIILPYILYYLDRLDKDKKWTIGYTIEAKK